MGQHNPSESEYRITEPRDHVCNPEVGGCGRLFTRRVHVHRKAGVPGVRCPFCEKVQEPVDADLASTVRPDDWRHGVDEL